MEKQVNLQLVDRLTGALSIEEVEKVRLHVEILIEGYHEARSQVGDLQLELASVKFDRDCLTVEHSKLKERLRDQPGGMAEASVAELVERLIDAEIPRNQKLPAVKFIKKCTGWSLMDSKRWVESHYYVSE